MGIPVGAIGVELAGDAGPGAEGHYAYRSPVTGGGYERLNGAPIVDAFYSDGIVVNGRIYYYVVTAADAPGNESARSKEASALPALVIGWANLQWPL